MGLPIRRVLPALGQRSVGPFLFLDHMGPTETRGIDVPPHPHIGLSTVTYLFSGEILHRDSVGSEQLIRPGELNWMTAGRGIVHSERDPGTPRAAPMRIHGLQIWAALPVALEETEPSFQHYGADLLPTLALPGARVRVMLGEAFGARSPAQTPSRMLFADVELQAELAFDADEQERAVYGVEGEVFVQGEPLAVGELLVLGAGSVRLTGSGRVALLGGDRLDGHRHIHWNFVSSRLELVEQAKRDWQQERFPLVPGDEHDRVPLPPEPPSSQSPPSSQGAKP